MQRPGLGVTKLIYSVPLFSEFCIIVKTRVSYQISRFYLTGVIATELRWHLLNMNVVKKSQRYFRNIKNFVYGEINERSFSNPTPVRYLLWYMILSQRIITKYRPAYPVIFILIEYRPLQNLSTKYKKKNLPWYFSPKRRCATNWHALCYCFHLNVIHLMNQTHKILLIV